MQELQNGKSESCPGALIFCVGASNLEPPKYR